MEGCRMVQPPPHVPTITTALSSVLFICTSIQVAILGAFPKLRKATMSFVMSVRPHGTPQLPLAGVSWNLIFEDFSKICRENSSLIKIGQEWRALYMETDTIFFIISRPFLLRMRNASDKSCRENQNTHFVFSNVFRKSFLRKYGKNILERAKPHKTIWFMRIACSIPQATNIYTQNM